MKSKFLSEFLGTAFLVMIVLGSGIMAQNLFPGQTGAALQANSLATGAGLFVLIQCLGSISGAHFNPIVSLVEFLWKRLEGKALGYYVLAQMAGAYVGVLSTHLMFDQAPFQVSAVDRNGMHILYAEFIATFGLISVVALAGKKHVEFAPLSVSAYIMSAYWFTSSTSFVNPAVTFARMFTNTFGGMAPEHYVGFTVAQIIGGMLAFALLRKQT